MDMGMKDSNSQESDTQRSVATASHTSPVALFGGKGVADYNSQDILNTKDFNSQNLVNTAV
eukprot:1046900-Karenia_brevis.AAC.1